MAQSPARGQSLAPILRLGLVLFNIFINYPQKEIQFTLSTVTDSRELKGVADIPDGCAATQRHPDNTGKMGYTECHEVQERETQSPAPGKNNPRHQYTLGIDKLKSSLA